MSDPTNPLKETASQTAGPFVHIGLAPKDAGIEVYTSELGRAIAGPDAQQGEQITVSGSVFDGAGVPVSDVLIEVWQADAQGTYSGAHDNASGFVGWGRVVPDFATGIFQFHTIKPGAVKTPDGGVMAPHLNLWLVARGVNIGLNTRMYFADETDLNDRDPILSHIARQGRRDTLIARQTPGGYAFDIRLQGDGETVFFDV